MSTSALPSGVIVGLTAVLASGTEKERSSLWRQIMPPRHEIGPLAPKVLTTIACVAAPSDEIAALQK